MRNIILFDNEVRDRLLPFTYIRPVCEIRVGTLTIREKWEKWLKGKVSFITQDHLSEKYDITISERNFLINGSALPSQELCSLIKQMEDGEAMLLNGELIAAVLDREQFNRLMYDDVEELSSFEVKGAYFQKINHLWDIFKENGQAIKDDFNLLTNQKKSQPISATNTVLGAENVFIEEGARIECSILNAEDGPIYIGKNAKVLEGAMIKGPFSMGEGSVVKMGTKIYGPTSIGPHCTVGGEIKNVVIFGHSNKGHEGYLGNSVIGEWCNIGADTNSSNLKNNWSEVKLWDFNQDRFAPTGELKAGLFMGDFSMCGINTMFNTGTIVGLCCNIFGGGYPRTFLPSFTWGGSGGLSTYKPAKLFESVEAMMKIHGSELPAEERLLLLKVFEESAKYRSWEKDDQTKKYLNLS